MLTIEHYQALGRFHANSQAAALVDVWDGSGPDGASNTSRIKAIESYSAKLLKHGATVEQAQAYADACDERFVPAMLELLIGARHNFEPSLFPEYGTPMNRQQRRVMEALERKAKR
jgi:hypothetical protein